MSALQGPGFRLPRLLLPAPGTDLQRWAVVACDQYTSEPEYWRDVERLVGDAPSTLQLIFPEVHLESPDAQARIAAIQQHMHEYLARGLLVEHAGPILVERSVHGRTRRGLMLELDLEHYDFSAASKSLIRPTEGTMVERLAPRIEVRKDAPLELPHILVLIDDPGCTVIEPLAAARGDLRRLYETELMMAGGHIVGHAPSEAAAARAVRALDALADPRAFAARHQVPQGTPPMLFAMGDGNHSLATAKAIWERCKAEVGPDHPSRHALVEVVNIHDPALDFAAIHRVLFGLAAGAAGDFAHALRGAFGPSMVFSAAASADAMRAAVQLAQDQGRQALGLVRAVDSGSSPFTVATLTTPPAPLAVSSFQPVIDRFLAAGGAARIDYVHGDDVVERLGLQAGQIGLHFAAIGKAELLHRVVMDGPTPRKTFSMGEAHEKRYYIEARRIR